MQRSERGSSDLRVHGGSSKEHQLSVSLQPRVVAAAVVVEAATVRGGMVATTEGAPAGAFTTALEAADGTPAAWTTKVDAAADRGPRDTVEQQVGRAIYDECLSKACKG